MIRPLLLFVLFVSIPLNSFAQTTTTVSTRPLSIKQIESLPKAQVARIIDGDTIEIKHGDGVERCRLLGVDCPELHGDRNTFYGKESAWFTYNLLAGESVWFETDPNIPRDTFGRLLIFAYRVPDGLCVNVELLRQGYARVYKDYNNPRKEVFYQAEALAREAMKGLWNPNLAKQAETKAESTKNPAEQKTAMTGATANDASTVFATKSGKKYHRAGCRSLRGNGIALTLSAAKAKGLTPCSVCKP